MQTNPPGKFHENQKFRQWWLILLLVGCITYYLAGSLQQLIWGIPFGDNPMSDSGLIFSLLFFIGFLYWFFFILKLEVKVDESGIQYKFHGLHFKYYRLHWDDIAEVESCTYKPILEFGGWGIRWGFKGKAYNVSGNKGIRVKTHNGARILFGTLKPDAFLKSINCYHKNSN